MPESNLSAPHGLPKLTESDFAIFDALQAEPRASWVDVGKRVGISAATVRRRWQRLEENGLAWISTYPGFASGVVRAIIRVKCHPGSVPSAANQIRTIPEILTLSSMTGSFDLHLTTFTKSMTDLRRVIQTELAAVDGVAAIHSSLISEVFREGSTWKVGALAERKLGPLKNGLDSRPALTDQAMAVLATLERSGRANAASISQAIETSEPHARRVTQKLIRDGVLAQRVDLSSEQSAWSHALAIWMDCPASQLASIAGRISMMPSTRLCTAIIGGPANLFVIVWLSSLEEAPDIEATIIHGFDVEVVDRSSILHYHKRMGHIFEQDGSYAGHVPWLQSTDGAQPTAK